jgi:chemotaxis protein methyltransferase CheR
MSHPPFAQAQPKPDSYERLRTWLNDRCGIFFSDNKKDLLVQRLGRVVEQFDLKGLDDLADVVEGGAQHDILLAVMHAASTNYTYFFREHQVLDFYIQEILPSFSRRDDVRVWCAAVSTGDEAYTAAMLAAEVWGREIARQRLAILGTDISESVISRAEMALYSGNHVEHTPPELLRRYFRPSGVEQFVVADDIRGMCTFRRLNLRAYPYPFQKPFDVVFCRNVLYYFDKENQRNVLEAIYDVTQVGGWLLTSVTENLRGLGTRWVTVAGGIHRKAP